MYEYSSTEIINIGVGEYISIRELAELVRDIVGYESGIIHGTTEPDGTPRKLLDVSKLGGLGWRAKMPLREGIEHTYRWFANTLPVEIRG